MLSWFKKKIMVHFNSFMVHSQHSCAQVHSTHVRMHTHILPHSLMNKTKCDGVCGSK